MKSRINSGVVCPRCCNAGGAIVLMMVDASYSMT
jgi:hypothetical protein